jgi:hypothetical protein
MFKLAGSFHVPKNSGTRLTAVAPSENDMKEFLQQLDETDAVLGQMAQKRCREYHLLSGIPVETYKFPTYKSAEEQKVWIHHWWVRPLRFFYRHLPRAIRSRIKRVAT